MPVMGGTEAAAAILRSYPRPDGRPVPYLIALTADATDGVEARCAMAGFRMVLNKPAGGIVIHGALRTALASLAPPVVGAV
jgi:CheY-like chemotaxis protein